MFIVDIVNFLQPRIFHGYSGGGETDPVTTKADQKPRDENTSQPE